MTRRRVPDDSATFEFSDEERDETLKVSTHRTASRSQDASKGELLRRERIGRPDQSYIRLREAARWLGITSRQLADYEAGRAEPTREEFDCILAVYASKRREWGG